MKYLPYLLVLYNALNVETVCGQTNLIDGGELDFKSKSIQYPMHFSPGEGVKTVFLTLSYQIKNGLLSTVSTSCSCAEIIDVESAKDTVVISIKVSNLIAQGVQNFSVIFHESDKKQMVIQNVSFFMGNAKCMLGRSQLKLAEIRDGESVNIPLRLFCNKVSDRPLVKIDGCNAVAHADLLTNDSGSSYYLLRANFSNPKEGIFWLTINSGNNAYRTPIIVTK